MISRVQWFVLQQCSVTCASILHCINSSKPGWQRSMIHGYWVKGNSAVSYIHIHELAKFLLTIIQQSHKLPSYDIYAASPDGSTSHQELFDIATKDYFGEPVKPIHIPKWIAYPGVLLRTMLGKMKITPPPFEKLWMLKYVDLRLNVNSGYTRKSLGWEPSPRHLIERRLLFLLARMVTRWNGIRRMKQP